ncbi:MAG: tetraacyldisaccharide 4'-kinase [Bacteroidota bacterium]
MMQLLRKIAFPFSLVYALIIHIRNFLYDKDIFRSLSYATPTICVGNLSVGGTGKTPMVEYLISILQEDFRVAILSRGYQRKSSGFVVADENSSVRDLGDEPYQISRKFPKAAVAVDADRRNGIVELGKRVQPDLILLDDAFQHRRVKPNFSMLLTVCADLYVDDWYLPTGNLRDGKREAQRADMIVVTKCDRNISIEDRKRILQKLRPNTDQLVVFSWFEYDPKLYGISETRQLSDLKKKRVALVTAIANPQHLVSYLKSESVLFDHFNFRDHHYFSYGEIDRLRQYDIVLTTEKDHTKLNGRLDSLFYIKVRHAFTLEDKALMLREIIKVAKLDPLL